VSGVTLFDGAVITIDDGRGVAVVGIESVWSGVERGASSGLSADRSGVTARGRQ